jgi:hypothetical protein
MANSLHPFRLRPPKNPSIKVELSWPQKAASGGVPTLPAHASTSELMTYWASQQARVGSHESARFSFSAFVVAGSLVALAQIGQGQMLAVGRWAVALSVIMANLVAVRFTLTELRWIKIHQARASAVLSVVLPEVEQMQRLASQQWYARTDSDNNSVRFTSSMALQVVHWLMALAALIMGLAVGSQ